jgi:hypothetical protein
MVGHVNAPHHEHPTFGLDLSHRLRRQIAFASRNLARLQCAPKVPVSQLAAAATR